MSGAALRRSEQPDEDQHAGLGLLIIDGRRAAEGEEDGDEGEAVKQAPEWIPLFPNARKIKARDGREWLMEDPDAVIAAFNDDKHADLMIDWDHNAADVGGWGSVTRAPAAGWIKELRKKGKRGIEGRVVWTGNGRASVETQEYRYISPWFQTTRPVWDEEGVMIKLPEIERILNAALVNMPALRMSALTRAERQPPTDPAAQAGETMNEAILAALGLTKTGTEADALAKIAELKVPKPVDPTAFVPKADYDAVASARETAEKERDEALASVAERDVSEREADVQAALDEANRQRTIAPKSFDYHRETMRAAGNSEGFRSEYISASAPPVIPTEPRTQPTLPTEGEVTAASLTKRELKTCRHLNLTPEQYAKTRNHENERLAAALEG